ncbi:MAG: hypothetical protein JEZ07_03560 [Phycisphaerae bacterium]|nr:hypothetical protein [Phycisphaerae bacterium]
MQDNVKNQRAGKLQKEIEQARRDFMLACLEQMKNQGQLTADDPLAQPSNMQQDDEINDDSDEELVSMQERDYLNSVADMEILAENQGKNAPVSGTKSPENAQNRPKSTENATFSPQISPETPESIPVITANEPAGDTTLDRVLPIESEAPITPTEVPTSFVNNPVRYQVSMDFIAAIMDQTVTEDILWHKQQQIQ